MFTERTFVVVLLAAGLAAAPAAPASEALAKKAQCFSCHALDKKVVGPSYRDVAARYRGKPEGAPMLVQKVRKGGSGAWGPVPMPPNGPDKLNDAELKTLVDWVLATR